MSNKRASQNATSSQEEGDEGHREHDGAENEVADRVPVWWEIWRNRPRHNEHAVRRLRCLCNFAYPCNFVCKQSSQPHIYTRREGACSTPHPRMKGFDRRPKCTFRRTPSLQATMDTVPDWLTVGTRPLLKEQRRQGPKVRCDTMTHRSKRLPKTHESRDQSQSSRDASKSKYCQPQIQKRESTEAPE